MATLTLNNPVTATLLSGLASANGYPNATQLQVTSGSETVFYGGSFSLNSFGQVIAGTLNSVTYTVSGVTQYTISGLSHDAATAYTYIISGNTFSYLNFIFNGNDVFNGSSGHDYLQSWGGNDSLFGNGGDDTLEGGAGLNTLSGGSGDDSYVVVTSGDVVVESAGAGFDRVYSQSDFTLPGEVERLNLLGGLSLYGSGNSGENIILSGNGNDTLDGAGAADILAGGAANDVYMIDNAGDLVMELGNSGQDEIRASTSYSLMQAWHVENLTLIGGAGVIGTGNWANNVITGNSGANLLNGERGNDTLAGGGGADTLAGGAGDDTFLVADASPLVLVEREGEGFDRAIAGISFTLADGVEELLLTGSANLAGTGNALANRITGTTGNNSLQGGLGDDTLDGGVGVDTLDGGDGQDSYYVDNIGDVLLDSAGIDSVFSSFDYVLGTAIENLTLLSGTNGTGNGSDNTLMGNAAANRLTGAGGNDTLHGGSADTLDGGSGNDWYVIEEGAGSYQIVELSGLDGISVAGSFSLSGFSVIENLLNRSGNAAALTGNAAANRITGGTGNDTLDGVGDADTLEGGAGDDSYVTGDLSDVLAENPGAGTDTVYTDLSWTLAPNFERLILGASGNTGGTGNDLANWIVGNSGNNTLSGGAGADTLIGNPGNDLFIADGDDLIMDSSGEDTIQSATSFSLSGVSGALEYLVLTGGAAINGTGAGSSDRIYGNSSANLLVGNAGGDTIFGGGGNDTLDGGDSFFEWLDGGDGDDWYLYGGGSIYEAAGGGFDTVVSNGFANIDISGQAVEAAYLTGAVSANIVGNELNNILTGNDIANNLSGSDGNDTLAGGGGNDILNGGAGADSMAGGTGDDEFHVDSLADQVVESPGDGVDTVVLFVQRPLSDFLNVENLQADNALGAVALSGNGGNNRIAGNSFTNYIAGAGGDDYLISSGGLDTLDGGSGNDTMEGYFLASDVFIVDSAGDVILPDFLGAYADTILSSVSYDLSGAHSSHRLNLTLTGSANLNASGSIASNVITGNSGNNLLQVQGGGDTLIGAGGTDTLVGGSGNDTFVIDALDLVVESVGQGTDTLIADFSLTLSAAFENATLIGEANLDLTGNAQQNTLSGNAGNNHIQGGDGEDSLVGNEGNDFIEGGNEGDVLDGGAGADTMIGGAGDDFFVVDDAGDLIQESSGGGIDSVNLSLEGNFALPDHFESARSLVFGNFNLTGNALDNSLWGNNSANVVSGGDGHDDLYGYDGADTLFGGQGNDTLHGTGYGDADVLAGGAGDDYYEIEIYDQVQESNGQGADTVVGAQSFVAYVMPDNFEYFLLTGFRSSVTGGSGGEILRAVGGINLVDGGGGNDTIVGGFGEDTLLGGLGSDILVWDAQDAAVGGGEGSDTLRVDGSGITLDLTLVADSLITDVEVIDLTGSGSNVLKVALADVLAISSGTDVLTVDGNAGDLVQLQGAWINAGGSGYVSYTQGLANVLIDTDVAVSLI